MSILLICPEQYARHWQKALGQQLPDVKIEIYPRVDAPEEVEFIVAWKPPHGVFEEFPNLKAVQSLGAGVENIIQSNTIPKGAVLCRIVDSNLASDMWEYILMASLFYLKNMPRYVQQQATTTWKQKRYKRIKDTRVSILGLGQIGSLVAKNFAALGFQVRGWSNSKKNIAQVETFVGEKELALCLADTDILVNILPLTAATTGILNQNHLQQLNEGAYLINAGRGGHLVESDLLHLLEVGHLSGAFLDVFSIEPLPAAHPFWTHPKIQITPHVASLTDLNSASEQIAENYRRCMARKELLHVVSVEKGY